jgi:ABC-type lipoprotein export system ATPase subunit
MLDEPTKQISSNFREKEFNFYKVIAEKFQRQLIIVSHSQELADLAENKIVIGA